MQTALLISTYITKWIYMESRSHRSLSGYLFAASCIGDPRPLPPPHLSNPP